MALDGIRADCQGACVTENSTEKVKMYLEEVSHKIHKGFSASTFGGFSCMTLCASEGL